MLIIKSKRGTIVSIEGEKNRNDFIIVVAVAGIFHGCIGDEIFPLLFRTVREDTRVMKSCRTHRWVGSVSSIFLPPDSFSYFRGGTPAGGFRRKPVYVPRREFEDISARKARQFHRASIRERRNIHDGCVYVYINFVVENPPVFGTKF